MLVELNNRIKQNKTKAIALAVFGMVALTCLAFGLAINPAEAAINKYLNYQGKLLDSSKITVSDATYRIDFRIYDQDAPGGSVLWSDSFDVDVEDGLFSVLLGSSGTLDLDFEANDGYWLSIEVEGDGEMTPRKEIGAAAYAFNSDLLDGLNPTTVGSTVTSVAAFNQYGNLTITGDPQGGAITQGSVYINPAAPGANETLLGIANNGSQRLLLDAEGDLTLGGYASMTDLFVEAASGAYINIEGSGSRLTSGAYLVGVNPGNISQSASTNVQFVLEDLSSAISSAGLWTDAAGYIYADPVGDYGSTGMRILDDGSLMSNADLVVDGLAGFNAATHTSRVLNVATSTLNNFGIYSSYSGMGTVTPGDYTSPTNGAAGMFIANGATPGYANTAVGAEATGAASINQGVVARAYNAGMLNAAFYGLASSSDSYILYGRNTHYETGDARGVYTWVGTSAAAGSNHIGFETEVDGAEDNYGAVLDVGDPVPGNVAGNVGAMIKLDGDKTNQYGVYAYVDGGASTNLYGLRIEDYVNDTVSGFYGVRVDRDGVVTNNGYGYYSDLTYDTANNKYGYYANVTGTAAANYGIYANASGGTTNWAGYFGGGNVYIQNNLYTSSSKLFLDSDTALSDTNNNDAGAYFVGTYDEFIYSDSTNVQDVLDDIDFTLDAVSSTAHIWTDAAGYVYPTEAGDYGSTGMRIYDNGEINTDSNLVVDGLAAFGTTTNTARIVNISASNSGGSGKYGLYSSISGSSSGDNFGISGVAVGSAGNTGYLYGVNGSVSGVIANGQTAYGGYFSGSAQATTTIGVYGYGTALSGADNAYGVYANGEGASGDTVYGLYATTGGPPGGTKWAGYFDSGNVKVVNSFYVSSTSAFSNYLTLSRAADNQPILYFASSTYTYNPGFRLASTTGQLEYRDQGSSSWTAFDNIGGLWTDSGTYIYATPVGDYGSTGMRIYDNGEINTDSNLVVDGLAAFGTATNTSRIVNVENTANSTYGVYSHTTTTALVFGDFYQVPSGAAGYFVADGNHGATTQGNIGLVGRAIGSSGYANEGIFGQAYGAGFFNAAYYGLASSTGSYILYGRNTHYTTGDARGVYTWVGTSAAAGSNHIGFEAEIDGGEDNYGSILEVGYEVGGGSPDNVTGNVGAMIKLGGDKTNQYGIHAYVDGDSSTNLYGINITNAKLDAVNSFYGVRVNRGIGVTSDGYGFYSNLNYTTANDKYGYYANVAGSAATNYGVYANASGATTNWAGYFDSGNVKVVNSFYVSSTSAFSDYLTLARAADNQPALFFASSTYANNPGFRLSNTSGKLEYRDENEAGWTPFDDFAASSDLLWTDQGTYIDPDNATGEFRINDGDGHLAIGGSAVSPSTTLLLAETWTAALGGIGNFYGIDNDITYSGATNDNDLYMTGASNYVTYSGAAGTSNETLLGVEGIAVSNNTGGLVNSVYGGYFSGGKVSGAGTVTDMYGVYAATSKVAGGTITNSYGVYSTASGATNNYAFYSPDAGGYSYFGDHVAIEDAVANADWALGIQETFSSGAASGYQGGASSTVIFDGTTSGNYYLTGTNSDVYWNGTPNAGFSEIVFGSVGQTRVQGTGGGSLDETRGLMGYSSVSAGNVSTSIGVFARSEITGGLVDDAYGLKASATGGTTNYAVYASTSGGGTKYAFYSPDAGGDSYFGDRVAIQDAAISNNWTLGVLDTYSGAGLSGAMGGVSSTAIFTGSSAGSLYFGGAGYQAVWAGTPSGVSDLLIGISSLADVTSTGSGSLGEVRAFLAQPSVTGGNVSTTYAVYANTEHTGGLVDDTYGGWFRGKNGVSENWGIYAAAKDGGTQYAGQFVGEGGAGDTTYGIYSYAHSGDGNYGGYFEAAGTGTANYGIYSYANNSADTNYGVYSRAVNASTNYAFYSPNNGGDAAFLDNVYIGGINETLSNPGFATSGDDLFVAGMAGIEGNVYTDGYFIASSTIALGEAASVGGFVSSSNYLSLIAHNYSTDYIYLDSSDGAGDQKLLWTEPNDNTPAGFRYNSSTAQMEYRDDGSSSWTPFDDLTSLWTDRGAYIDPDNATGNFKIADTTGYTAIGSAATTTSSWIVDIGDSFSGAGLSGQMGGVSTSVEFTGSSAGNFYFGTTGFKSTWNGTASAAGFDMLLGTTNQSFVTDTGGNTLDQIRGMFTQVQVQGGFVSTSYAVYANNDHTGGLIDDTYGGWFGAKDGVDDNYGVYGEAQDGNSQWGGSFHATGGAGDLTTGVRGVASSGDTNYGGYFQSSGSGTANYGGYATVTGPATNNYGFYATASGASNNYGVYAQGTRAGVYVTNPTDSNDYAYMMYNNPIGGAQSAFKSEIHNAAANSIYGADLNVTGSAGNTGTLYSIYAATSGGVYTAGSTSYGARIIQNASATTTYGIYIDSNDSDGTDYGLYVDSDGTDSGDRGIYVTSGRMALQAVNSTESGIEARLAHVYAFGSAREAVFGNVGQSGGAYSINGVTASVAGSGGYSGSMKGVNATAGGATYAVGSNAYAGYFAGTATASTTYGVYATASNGTTADYGVYGEASDAGVKAGNTGNTQMEVELNKRVAGATDFLYGLYVSEDDTAEGTKQTRGVYSYLNKSHGLHWAGYFETEGNGGRAIYAETTGSAGNYGDIYAVEGLADGVVYSVDSAAYASYFKVDATATTTYAVYADADGASGMNYAFYAPDDGDNYSYFGDHVGIEDATPNDTAVLYISETYTGTGNANVYGIRNRVVQNTNDDSALDVHGVYNEMNNWGAGVEKVYGTNNYIDYDEYIAATTRLYGTQNYLKMAAGAGAGTTFDLTGEYTYIDITESTNNQNAIYGDNIYIISDGTAGDPSLVYGVKVDFEASGASVGSGNWYGLYVEHNLTTSGNLYGLYLSGDGNDAFIGGDLSVGGTGGADDDYIYFDAGQEWLRYDEVSDNKFEISGNFGIGEESNTIDHYLYFNQQAEYLMWDYSDDRFLLSDSLSIGADSAIDDDYLYFDQEVEWLVWNDSSNKFVLTDDLEVNDHAAIGANATISSANVLQIQENTSGVNTRYDLYITRDATGTNTAAVDHRLIQLDYDYSGVADSGGTYTDGAWGMVIDVDANASSGTFNRAYGLWISNISLEGDTGSGEEYAAYFGDSVCIDNMTGGGSCPANPVEGTLYYDNTPSAFDLAESYHANELLESGQIVITYGGASDTVDIIAKQYDPRIFGAVTTNPNIMFGLNEDLTFTRMGGSGAGEVVTDKRAAVTISGRTPVKVNNSNGDIKIGDTVTTSSVRGEGMKATKPGTVVGWALEDLNGAVSGTISVYISPHWNSNGAIHNDGASGTFNDNFAFEPSGSATSSTPAVSSFGLTFRASGWDSASSTERILGMTIKNEVSSTDEFGLSFYNNDDDKVAFISNSGDLMLGNKLYPSDRGAMQDDYYIFLNTSGPGGKPYMMTNAAGWSTGSYDFAEMFPSDQLLQAGEIVTVGSADESVVRSASAYQTSIAGIVSTEPGFIAGDFTTSTYPIALAGRVPTKVTNAGGAIAIGDPITTSDIPGVGMKATSAGPIVGYALEASNAASDEIIVYVNPGWYGGGATGALPGATGDTSGFDPATSGDVTYLSGALDMQGNDIYGVNRIYGNGYKWEIDENGVAVSQVSTAGGDKPVYGITANKAEIIISGSGTTENGKAIIEFTDAVANMFDSANLNIKVIVTPTSADTPGLAVTSKSSAGFTVEELNSGTGNITFDWIFMAPRTGYEVELDDYLINSSAPDSATSTDPISDGSGSTTTDPISDGSGSTSTDPISDGSGSTSTDPISDGSGSTTTDPVTP